MKNSKSCRVKDDNDSFQAQYICQNENCHARLTIRAVNPDQDGNKWGVYGCLSHQHPLDRKNKAEIIFKNKSKAQEFANQYLKSMYSLEHGPRKEWQRISFMCRRKRITTGHVDCQSSYSIRPTFPR